MYRRFKITMRDGQGNRGEKRGREEGEGEKIWGEPR